MREFLDKEGAKYLIVGGLNTIFGYFVGVFLYYFLIKYIETFFILIITNIISITFSFLTYKIFVFKTSGYWLKEYAKSYIVYSGSSLIGIVLTWVFLEIFFINIWISQSLSISMTVFFSYYGHKKFTFKKKNE